METVTSKQQWSLGGEIVSKDCFLIPGSFSSFLAW